MTAHRSLATWLLVLALLAAEPAAWASEQGEHAHDHHFEEHGEEDHAGHSHGISEDHYEAALAQGQDPCALEEPGNYDLPMHIGSVFILLGVSLLGSLGPVALRAASASPRTGAAIKLGTLFGCGTILSTALIHMMLPAVESLGNPCLPSFWKEAYEAWPYLFMTVAIMLMQLLDYLIKGYFRRRSAVGGAQAHGAHSQHGHGCHTAGSALIGAFLSDPRQPAQQAQQDVEGGEANDSGEACPVHGEGCNTLLKHKPDTSQTVGIYMAEAGIIFHSVMIGLTLGVADGDAFITLLIALSLHQFFEGFAIGSAAVDAGLGVVKCTLMGLAYSITTPVGIAVGIAVRASFNQNATSTLLATGILDATSAGVLLYVVLVQLISPLMTDSDWLHSRPWPVQVVAFGAFYAGAAVMAVIGKWA